MWDSILIIRRLLIIADVIYGTHLYPLVVYIICINFFRVFIVFCSLWGVICNNVSKSKRLKIYNNVIYCIYRLFFTLFYFVIFLYTLQYFCIGTGFDNISAKFFSLMSTDMPMWLRLFDHCLLCVFMFFPSNLWALVIFLFIFTLIYPIFCRVSASILFLMFGNNSNRYRLRQTFIRLVFLLSIYFLIVLFSRDESIFSLIYRPLLTYMSSYIRSYPVLCYSSKYWLFDPVLFVAQMSISGLWFRKYIYAFFILICLIAFFRKVKLLFLSVCSFISVVYNRPFYYSDYRVVIFYKTYLRNYCFFIVCLFSRFFSVYLFCLKSPAPLDKFYLNLGNVKGNFYNLIFDYCIFLESILTDIDDFFDFIYILRRDGYGIIFSILVDYWGIVKDNALIPMRTYLFYKFIICDWLNKQQLFVVFCYTNICSDYNRLVKFITSLELSKLLWSIILSVYSYNILLVYSCNIWVLNIVKPFTIPFIKFFKTVFLVTSNFFIKYFLYKNNSKRLKLKIFFKLLLHVKSSKNLFNLNCVGNDTLINIFILLNFFEKSIQTKNSSEKLTYNHFPEFIFFFTKTKKIKKYIIFNKYSWQTVNNEYNSFFYRILVYLGICNNCKPEHPNDYWLREGHRLVFPKSPNMGNIFIVDINGIVIIIPIIPTIKEYETYYYFKQFDMYAYAKDVVKKKLIVIISQIYLSNNGVCIIILSTYAFLVRTKVQLRCKIYNNRVWIKYAIFLKKWLKDTSIISSSTSINKHLDFKKIKNLNFQFLRKNKVYNKGRYSRTRQNYRTGVYMCMYLSVISILGLYYMFFGFIFNFSYLWWLFIGFVTSFFIPKIIKYRLYEPYTLFYKFFDLFSFICIFLKNFFKI